MVFVGICIVNEDIVLVYCTNRAQLKRWRPNIANSLLSHFPLLSLFFSHEAFPFRFRNWLFERKRFALWFIQLCYVYMYLFASVCVWTFFIPIECNTLSKLSLFWHQSCNFSYWIHPTNDVRLGFGLSLSVNNVNKSNKPSRQDFSSGFIIKINRIVVNMAFRTATHLPLNRSAHGECTTERERERVSKREMNRASPMEVGCPNSHTLCGHLSVSISKPWVGNQLFD